MMGKDKVIIVILAVAIAVVAAALVMTTSSDKTPTGPDQPSGPDDPGKPVYPEGISFDENTGELTSTGAVTWNITDLLVAYADRTTTTIEGDKVPLSTGLYSVKVGDDTFNVTVPGTKENTLSWKYYYEGEYHDVSVTYYIDISELSDITLKNREWNKTTHTFNYLPEIVNVNETVKGIEAQLSAVYVQLGGLMGDRQNYADFLVSFAQLGIKYPTRMGPENSTDYEIWGADEYWANTLETLYFGIGDCEDSAAVACALFKAAGFEAAMVGVPGHVTAGVSLDFREVDMEEFKKYNSLYNSFKVAEGTSAVDTTDPTIYYGVDTTKKQVPVGYMLKGSVDSLGKPTLIWGMAGFYPVA